MKCKDEIKILIVDDEPHVLDAVSSLIKEFGYSSVTCDNTDDAIALVRKECFDTVLTDIRMRKTSGFELLEDIKMINADIPVILMTAYADLDNAINAIKKGAFDLITKPFSSEDLMHSLEKAVKHYDLIKIERKYKIFKKFTETSEQGLWMADLEGKITFANSALCRILDIDKPEDASKTNIRKFYSDEDVLKLDNDILPKIIEQGHKTLEMPLLSNKGKITPTIQSMFLIRDEQDRPFCLANIITNISERRKIEKTLRDHHDRLEELVTERTNELNDRVKELEKFYDMSVGRELRMKELKSKIIHLESELSGYKTVGNISHSNCWDFWECPLERRNECPAYKFNAGRECYDVASNYCPRVGRDFVNCWECPWYKKLQSDTNEK